MGKRPELCLVTSCHNHFDLITNQVYFRGYSLKSIVFTNSETTEGKKQGIPVFGKTQLETAVAECDIVLFPAECGIGREELRKLCRQKWMYGKLIFCANELLPRGAGSVTVVPLERLNRLHVSMNTVESAVPLLVIAGNEESVNKLPVALRLREVLETKYQLKVSVVSGNTAGALFGFRPYPFDKAKKRKSPEESILFFKKFMGALCRAETPDIVILTVPGGILETEDSRNFNSEYELKQINDAVGIDFTILLVSLENSDCLAAYRQEFAKRFCMHPDCVVLSDVLKVGQSVHSKEKRGQDGLTVNPRLYKKLYAEAQYEDAGVESIMEIETIAAGVVASLNEEYERYEIL